VADDESTGHGDTAGPFPNETLEYGGTIEYPYADIRVAQVTRDADGNLTVKILNSGNRRSWRAELTLRRKQGGIGLTAAATGVWISGHPGAGIFLVLSVCLILALDRLLPPRREGALRLTPEQEVRLITALTRSVSDVDMITREVAQLDSGDVASPAPGDTDDQLDAGP
jgi:hypothetical protein